MDPQGGNHSEESRTVMAKLNNKQNFQKEANLWGNDFWTRKHEHKEIVHNGNSSGIAILLEKGQRDATGGYFRLCASQTRKGAESTKCMQSKRVGTEKRTWHGGRSGAGRRRLLSTTYQSIPFLPSSALQTECPQSVTHEVQSQKNRTQKPNVMSL